MLPFILELVRETWGVFSLSNQKLSQLKLSSSSEDEDSLSRGCFWLYNEKTPIIIADFDFSRATRTQHSVLYEVCSF